MKQITLILIWLLSTSVALPNLLPTASLPEAIGYVDKVFPPIDRAFLVTFVNEDGTRADRDDLEKHKRQVRSWFRDLETISSFEPGELFEFSQSTKRAGDFRVWLGGDRTGASYVGTDCWRTSRGYTMKVEVWDADSDGDVRFARKVIWHELGHSFGLKHNHTWLPIIGSDRKVVTKENKHELFHDRKFYSYKGRVHWTPDASIMTYRQKMEDLDLGEFRRLRWNPFHYTKSQYFLSIRDVSWFRNYRQLQEKHGDREVEPRYKTNEEVVEGVRNRRMARSIVGVPEIVTEGTEICDCEHLRD